MQIRPIHAIAVLLAVLLIVLNFDKCAKIKQATDEKADLLQLLRSGGYEMEEIGNGIKATKALQLELTSNQSRLLVENDKLRREVKDLQAKVGVYVVTEYDSIILPVDSAEIIRTATANLLKLPYSNTYESRWLNFRQTIDTAGNNVLHDLTIEDSLSFHIYTAKRKLKDVFKPRVTKISMKSENPYTNFEGAKALTIKQKRSFAEKPIVNILAGVAMGFLIFKFY